MVYVRNRHFAASATRSALQKRGLIDRGMLLEQIIEVSLPVARLGSPGESAWEGRICPARHDPAGVVQHAQRAQRLDEQHFAKVEVRELLVPLEKLLPLALLLVG